MNDTKKNVLLHWWILTGMLCLSVFPLVAYIFVDSMWELIIWYIGIFECVFAIIVVSMLWGVAVNEMVEEEKE